MLVAHFLIDTSDKISIEKIAEYSLYWRNKLKLINMATVRIKFKSSLSEKGDGFLCYHVNHFQSSSVVCTDYKLFDYEWDKKSMCIRDSALNSENRGFYLSLIKERLEVDLGRFQKIIQQLEQASCKFTAREVAKLFKTMGKERCFIAFAKHLVAKFNEMGKVTLVRHYSTALSSFLKFYGKTYLPFEELDSDLIMCYEAYLLERAVCLNTASYYMRNLRAIYNRAVEQKLISQNYPFKRVYTGVCKTVKRAVSLDVLRNIHRLDMEHVKPGMIFARDMFMFSFYTRGMSFVDMAFLRKKDLKNGLLIYRRRKTGQLLTVKWEKPMQEIVDKYEASNSPYLLPIIKDLNKDARTQYISQESRLNYYLKKLGNMLGLDIPLTMYVARHSWASIARNKFVPISVISEALGHTSESTTRVYLDTLDTSMVNEANLKILRLL